MISAEEVASIIIGDLKRKGTIVFRSHMDEIETLQFVRDAVLADRQNHVAYAARAKVENEREK